MAPSTQAKTKSKAEQEAQHKAVRRAEQANILAGVRPLLDKDEQLLSFARARIAGGWRSKLNVGPEAFFAPYVNLALTERRFLVQHIQPASGKPSQMLPHAYTFDKIARVTFTDIETFSPDPACRVILHLENNLFVRLRLRGLLNVESAKSMAKLFDSLTSAKRATSPAPTQSACPQCERLIDQPHRFCPYCGTPQPPRTTATAETFHSSSHSGITIAIPVVDTPAEALEQATEQALPPTDQTPSTLSSQPAMAVSILRETDFAYEREDRQAEFGFALPLPDSILIEEIEVEEIEVSDEANEVLAANEAEETNVEIVKAAHEIADADFSHESLNDIDLFAVTTEVVENKEPEIEQYEAPAFTEAEDNFEETVSQDLELPVETTSEEAISEDHKLSEETTSEETTSEETTSEKHQLSENENGEHSA